MKYVFAYKMPSVEDLEEITDEFGRVVPFIPVPESNAYLVLIDYDENDPKYKREGNKISKNMIPKLALGFKQHVVGYDYDQFRDRKGADPAIALEVLEEEEDVESDSSS